MTMLGAYQVLQKLGEGGMGEVLLGIAPDRSLVVLKVPLHPSPETTARLRDEARVGFRLQHPNIVRTRDFFMAGTKPVLVIDFVDGASLKDLREQRGALPAAMVAQIGRQIASALSFIHTATDEQGRPLNMLHRDVTPGNILVNRQGQALLIDLGIARSDENTAGKTSTGILKGTFRYLCPDLFTGSNYSSGTDLWALGVSLFESAMGRKAATGGQQLVLAAIIGGRIMQLQAHETLHPLLLKTFHSLLRTDDASRRITDASQLERVFAGIADKLGDGDAEARALMRVQPQGDVSGEFGADDLVPTIYDERGLAGLAEVGGAAGPSSSDVFAPLPSRSPATPPGPPAGLPTIALPASALPRGIPRENAPAVVDDLQGPTMILPQQPAAPLHPPRPPVAAPVSAPVPLPTLQIPIFVVEDDIDISDFDAPAPTSGLPTIALPAVRAPQPLAGLPTIALPAVRAPQAMSSSDAPPTVALPAAVLPSAFAPATVVAMPQAHLGLTALPSTPVSSDAPLTMIMSPSMAASMSVQAPTPAAPTSEDAPATMIVAAHHLPPTHRPATPPATTPATPVRQAPRPTLELPIFVEDDVLVDDDDPPRE